MSLIGASPHCIPQVLVAAGGIHMLRIEVWKAKSAWQNLSKMERTAFLKSFGELMQLLLPKEAREGGGPFLVDKPGISWLVWTSGIQQVQDPSILTEEAELARYFDALMYMTPSRGVTARSVATQLFGSGPTGPETSKSGS